MIDSGRDYWFGLYKLNATANGATEWYDGNPSNYTNWDDAAGEPNENTICIRYTRFGFKDRSCWAKFYFTCKKPAGNFCAIYLLRTSLGVFTLFYCVGLFRQLPEWHYRLTPDRGQFHLCLLRTVKQDMFYILNLSTFLFKWRGLSFKLYPILWFLSASLYLSKRGAYWDRLCRDVVGRWLVGCHARAPWPNGAS